MQNLLNTERGKRMFCKQNIFKYKRKKIVKNVLKQKRRWISNTRTNVYMQNS